VTARTDARPIDLPIAAYVVGLHVALAVGLPLYFLNRTPSVALVVTTLVILFFTEIGIGASYHRYYAHRCYRAKRPAEGFLLFLATLAFQGSALRWSHDHRKHHAYVDTDDDPYSISKGFFYAHMGWLFYKSEPIDERRVRDLAANPLVKFQHRWFALLGIGSNALVFAVVGWATGEWLGAFVLTWWTRLLLSYHLTWFINSLAHTWGSRTYSREHTAVDNFVIALLTVGEGYHNYHHTFASDYRNGARWYHFDPTKWTIWLLSKVGQTSDLKRYSRALTEGRLLEEDRKLLLKRLSAYASATRADLEARVHALADAVQEKRRRLVEATEELKRLGAEKKAPLAEEIRALRASVRHDMREWGRLCREVLKTVPSTA
jgi:stearoyl-CoA desaturase (delta-9 desaturase)